MIAEERIDSQVWFSGATNHTGTTPVGMHPPGATQLGVHNMLGNFSEWAADHFENFTSTPGPCWLPYSPVNPICLTSTDVERTMRQGSYANTNGAVFRAASRHGVLSSEMRPAIGFRCMRSR